MPCFCRQRRNFNKLVSFRILLIIYEIERKGHYELSSLSMPVPSSDGNFRFSCLISTIGSAADRVGPDIIDPGGCIGTEGLAK